MRDLIRLIVRNSDDYDEKLNSDEMIHKTIEIRSMIIVTRAVFHVNNKYYPQVVLGEYLYKL